MAASTRSVSGQDLPQEHTCFLLWACLQTPQPTVGGRKPAGLGRLHPGHSRGAQGTVITGQARERARSGLKSQPFRQPGFPLISLPGSLLHCQSVQGRCGAFYCSPEQPLRAPHRVCLRGPLQASSSCGWQRLPRGRAPPSIFPPTPTPSLLKACKAGPRRLCLPESWPPWERLWADQLRPCLPGPPQATGANMLLWGLRLAPDSCPPSSALLHLSCPVGHFPVGAGEPAVKSGLHTGATPGLISLTPTSCSLNSPALVSTWRRPCCPHGLGGTRGSVFPHAPGSSPSC